MQYFLNVKPRLSFDDMFAYFNRAMSGKRTVSNVTTHIAFVQFLKLKISF